MNSAEHFFVFLTIYLSEVKKNCLPNIKPVVLLGNCKECCLKKFALNKNTLSIKITAVLYQILFSGIHQTPPTLLDLI